jgi:hypothetical protein
MTIVSQVKIYNTWNSKKNGVTTTKQEEDELVIREKKTFRPPYFQISYLPHFLYVLNNLKIYENVI